MKFIRNPYFLPMLLVFLTMLGTLYFAASFLARQPSNPTQETGSGQAAIGGRFSLTDNHGNPYTDQNLKGHYSLIFFGFTHCPDICPTALSAITGALDSLYHPISRKITPVFITVDPARDTPEKLTEYIHNFHPRMVALTGSEADIEALSRAYKNYYEKEAETGEDQYMMSHSGYIYLMDKNGVYLTHFQAQVTPDHLAAELAKWVH